jgi:flagellar biosynthesis/type III secretory pathway M-ring protein FliF/YscJ
MKPLSASVLSGHNSPMLTNNSNSPMLQQNQGSQPKIESTFKMEQHHPEDEQLQKVLTRMTEENPASVAEIIQLWLAEDGNR